MTTTLVTGGAGFIGSHLVEALVRQGDAVRVLDNFSTGRAENLAAVAQHVQVVRGDIRDRETVRAAMQGVERVFHQAATVSVALSVRDPLANHDANVTGALNLLEAAREAGVQSFVFASSAAVYGDIATLPLVETMPVAPISPYGLAKSIGEQYAQLYSRAYGLHTVGLRYFNVYGPRQEPSSPYSGVISIFADHLLAGTSPTIYGDGQQTRDFVFVADVVQANLLAAVAPGTTGQVYNISTCAPHTIIELWEALQGIAGVYLPARFSAPRPGDVRYSHSSYQKAQRCLGFEPHTAFAEGLRQTVDWHRGAR